MGFPLYLALTAAEMKSAQELPNHFAYMACHFSPYGEGMTNIPSSLPEGAMLILNDRMPCRGHSADLVAHQLADAVARFGCESVLLDFQHPVDAESEKMASRIVTTLTCPVAVSAAYAKDLSCPVFLPPCPPHLPMADFLAPWQDREIWLEAALCQEKALVTRQGTEFSAQFSSKTPDGGFFDEVLCCQYLTAVSRDRIEFLLFDTPQSLRRKLDIAHSLGAVRAVGLFQELG